MSARYRYRCPRNGASLMSATACDMRRDQARWPKKIKAYMRLNFEKCLGCPGPEELREGKTMAAMTEKEGRAKEAKTCPRCGERPVMIRADGISMGRCEVCLAADRQKALAARRAKKAGSAAKRRGRPPASYAQFGPVLREKAAALRAAVAARDCDRETFVRSVLFTAGEVLAVVDVMAAAGALGDGDE